MRIANMFTIGLFLLQLGGLAQEPRANIRETFGPDTAAEFADRWETIRGNWQIHDDRLHAASPSSRAFAYLPDIPEATELQVEALLKITDRDTPGGWAVAGVTAYLGPTDFWQLALVEGPDKKPYVELVEMFGGTWQAQREKESALEETERQGQWDGWEHNHDYKLVLSLSPDAAVGTVTDPATGKTITRIAYAWGRVRGVKSGRPGLLVSGFQMAVRELTGQWASDTSELLSLNVQSGERGTVAFLEVLPSQDSTATASLVAQALRKGGYGVTPLTCRQLATPGVLDSRRFDALVLPDSPRFPVVAMDQLHRFLRGGGDLVLMGGLPFSHPLHQVGEEWITEAEFKSRLAATPLQNLMFDFEDGKVSSWQRSTNHPDHPSNATVTSGPTGKALLLDIRGLKGWDTFSIDFPEGLEASHNALCFEAKASQDTPAMIVEVREKDGSRWIATVEMNPEWKHCVIPVTQFEFWGDSTNTGRGTPGDMAHFSEVNYLSFGLAGSHIGGIEGDHRLWIDQIGTAHAQIPSAIPRNEHSLNAFSDYAVYRMKDIRQIAPAELDAPVRTNFTVEMSCSGWSAVGFAFPNESRFIPLLSANDAQERSQGWAAGALLNFRGAYRNSTWLMFGLETPAFYRNPAFLAQLPGLLAQVTSPDLIRQLRRTEREKRSDSYALESPPPHTGFIRRSDDGRHLIYPDGRRFFMIGCNYVGGFTRCAGRMWADDTFDAREVEDDFRKAHEAGLNVMRYWIQGTLDQDIRHGNLGKVQTIRECARRYGVYLLLDLPGTGYSSEKAMLASHRAIANAFRDEPMVLGYDLRNEPYVTTLGGINYTDNKPPVQTVDLNSFYPGLVDMSKVDAWLEERPWWLHLPRTIQGDEARRVTVANVLWNDHYLKEFDLRSSSMPGLDGNVPVGRWGKLIEVVDQSLARWIDTQVKAIREVDPNHLITVGHNTALCMLPANQELDFVSKHTYIRPYSREHVVENITVLDRLKRLWPDQPITLGEFGYSNGIAMEDGYLDPYTSSVGEMIHFLYAFANDYDGCKKWMLVDWPLAVMRHYGDWNRGLKTRTYEERFGLFSYDGTRHGRPKPIVPALHFFRRLIDRSAPGGRLTLTDDANPIGTGYVFRTDGALFSGGRKVDLPELQFTCPETTNVMLTWDAKGLRLMSTADVTAEIDLKELAPELATRDLKLASADPLAKSLNGRWTLSLQAGKTVVLK